MGLVPRRLRARTIIHPIHKQRRRRGHERRLCKLPSTKVLKRAAQISPEKLLPIVAEVWMETATNDRGIDVRQLGKRAGLKIEHLEIVPDTSARTRVR